MNRHGYTLTEVLVTVAIIGVLAGASVTFYAKSVKQERWDAANDVLRTIFTGEQMYFNLNAGTSYYPPPPALGTSTLNSCLPGDAVCRNNWRNFVYTDYPGISLIDYWIFTWKDAPPTSTQRFNAVARYLNGNLCMTIDDLGAVQTSPSPLPSGCTAGWPPPP